MKFLKILDKLFSFTQQIEEQIETVSKRTRLTIEKIMKDITRSLVNLLILCVSLLLVVSGLIILAAKYAPIEYVLLFIGLLGFVVVALQKISIGVKR